MSYTNIPSNLTASQRRHALQKEIYKWAHVPTPADNDLLEELFDEVTLTTWCRAVGVAYTINKDPDPEWRVKRTITFRDTRGEDEMTLDCDSIDL